MTRIPFRRVCIVGGAGFIGSHLVGALLQERTVERLSVFDNLSSGRLWHLEGIREDPRLSVVIGDVEDTPKLTAAIQGHEHVIHLASNPDIAKAIIDPTVDYHQGTALTHAVLEAARLTGARRVIYSSGSGVYGEVGEVEVAEDYGPLHPISTYGASKLAGEALMCAYCHMFDISGFALRFANVVGPRQTHGVGYDFIRRLLKDPAELTILGDGSQSKPYIHIDDVISAIRIVNDESDDIFASYNVGPDDFVTVREIADLAVAEVVGPGQEVRYHFTGGDRGWKGDVPLVRLSTERLRGLGWKNQRTSRQAVADALGSIAIDARAGRLDG